MKQIDSASVYKNEAGCGAAIRKISDEIPRDQIYFTSKGMVLVGGVFFFLGFFFFFLLCAPHPIDTEQCYMNKD